MLEELPPRKCGYYRSLPFLGPVLDGFDDWLVQRGYALLTRRYCLNLLGCVDRSLQGHYRCKLHELTAQDWETCRRRLAVRDSRSARIVTTMRRYLEESGNIAPSRPEDRDPLRTCVDRYADYLRKVRGFEPKTIKEQSFTTARFVNHLSCVSDGFAVTQIKSTEVECFIDASSFIRSQGSMQHVVAHVRGFLRFLELSEHLPPTLQTEIDTPQVYRLEKPPRALPWDVVKAFLESVERAGGSGLRDYAIFTLMGSIQTSLFGDRLPLSRRRFLAFTPHSRLAAQE